MMLIARFNTNGLIVGSAESLRDIIRKSGAKIVIVASEKHGPELHRLRLVAHRNSVQLTGPALLRTPPPEFWMRAVLREILACSLLFFQTHAAGIRFVSSRDSSSGESQREPETPVNSDAGT